MRSIIVKIREAELNEDGQWLLATARHQSAHLAAILQPRSGLIYAEINNEDTDDIIVIRVESKLSYAERARTFGIQGMERHPRCWNGKLGPQGWPIPTEEHLATLEAFYGADHQGGMTSRWYVPEPLVRRAQATPDDGARIINEAGSHLHQWLDAGQFQTWRDPDWMGQSDVAEAVGLSATTIRNAVRDGRLATWDDPTEPNPQRRTRVRRSEVLRRWQTEQNA